MRKADAPRPRQQRLEARACSAPGAFFPHRRSGGESRSVIQDSTPATVNIRSFLSPPVTAVLCQCCHTISRPNSFIQKVARPLPPNAPASNLQCQDPAPHCPARPRSGNVELPPPSFRTQQRRLIGLGATATSLSGAPALPPRRSSHPRQRRRRAHRNRPSVFAPRQLAVPVPAPLPLPLPLPHPHQALADSSLKPPRGSFPTLKSVWPRPRSCAASAMPTEATYSRR